MKVRAVVGTAGLLLASAALSGCICLTWEPHWGRGSDTEKTAAKGNGDGKHLVSLKDGDWNYCPCCGRPRQEAVQTVQAPPQPAAPAPPTPAEAAAPAGPGVQQASFLTPPPAPPKPQ
ncbi:MAG TPA: hypothetical protein VFA26_17890 [Gemmataceae bacterium]|nr:hypothetical protein [Gemmataceae bacterium]